MGSKAPTAPPKKPAASRKEEFVVSEASLAKAFTEWDRRYRDEPERFQSEAARLLKDTPESYGAACAPYLLALLRGSV